jgi:hypothetical protein
MYLGKASRLGIPPLAGIASVEEAMAPGIEVAENVELLRRYNYVERRLFELMLERLCPTPEWEVKQALSLHLWLDTEHGSLLRARVAEIRHPPHRMDECPDPRLAALMDEVETARDTPELLAAIYRVVKPALRDAYRRHLTLTNPVADHPTRRILRFMLIEEEEMVEWGQAALRAVTEGCRDSETQGQGSTFGARIEDEGSNGWRGLLTLDARLTTYERHLGAYLAAAGGIHGAEPAGDQSLPPPREKARLGAYVPRRDGRFSETLNFNFPPHAVYKDGDATVAERNLALLCKRILEMDVPEMMASIIGQAEGKPWEYRREMARQLWDEARHCMMGEVGLESMGVDWTRLPIHIGFSLGLNSCRTPEERHAILWAIEHGLMSKDGKRYERETAVASGDRLSALFHDYDWADEVLHAQIGRRWLVESLGGPQKAAELAAAASARACRVMEEARAVNPQRDWWPEFTAEVLGEESVRATDTHNVSLAEILKSG